MSQPVGSVYKSRIPELQDDASIEEALRVYHYGVDNYTTQPIPDDSIEGNFRTLAGRIAASETSLISRVSLSSNPNVIEPQSASVTPLEIKAVSGQTSNLQNWKDSSNSNVAAIFSNGSSSFEGYITIGNISKSTTTALDIRIADSSHVGVAVKAAPGQSANIQEWRNSSNSAVSWIDNEGRIYYRGDEISGGPGSFFLMGA